MNRPWMPLDIPDYLADTGHLSTLEHGAYMLLIMHYWQKNGLPDDDTKLARIARLQIDQWLEIRGTIADLFLEGWKHKRVAKEIAHAEDIIGKRRAAADQRHNKGNANADQKNTHARVPVIVSKEEVESPEIEALSRARGVGAFPQDGSIAYSPYADVARRAKPGVDPDILASNFRKFCYSKQIPFDDPYIEKTFSTYCRKHKVQGLHS